MKQAVDYIEGQLRLDVMTAAFGFDLSYFRPDDELASQSLGPWITHGKAQNISRLIVTEIPFIELMNGRIIDESQADLRFGNAFFLQDGPNDFPQPTTVDCNKLLRAG